MRAVKARFGSTPRCAHDGSGSVLFDSLHHSQDAAAPQRTAKRLRVVGSGAVTEKEREHAAKRVRKVPAPL